MKLSLATRIFLGYAVVLVTFGAVSIFAVAELHQNQAELRLLTEGYLPLSQEVASLAALHQNQRQDTRRLLSEESADARGKLFHLAQLNFPPVEERLHAARTRAAEISGFASSGEATFTHELTLLLEALDESHMRYVGLVRTLFEQHGVPAGDTPAEMIEALRAQDSAMGRDLRRLQASLENRIRQGAGDAERRERRTGLAILALSLLAIGVGLLATAVSAKALKPVRTLIDGVSRIGRGDYTAQLGVRGDDEIAILAREFDAMATSLRHREAQLRTQQEALLRAEQFAAAGRISAQVAHEIRNPLSSIGLNVELLEEAFAEARFSRENTRGEVREILSAVTREVDRLTEITEEYLRMARVARPTLMLEDLNAIVRSVVEFSREELSRSGVRVALRLEEALPPALADEGQLRQVFLNLLRNSREAMPDGGQITVETRSREGQVEARFSDTGGGMSSETQQRIFEPFFSTKESGSGLGLSVCWQILKAHNGAIDCESHPGKGTRFAVALPRAQGQIC